MFQSPILLLENIYCHQFILAIWLSSICAFFFLFILAIWLTYIWLFLFILAIWLTNIWLFFFLFILARWLTNISAFFFLFILAIWFRNIWLFFFLFILARWLTVICVLFFPCPPLRNLWYIEVSRLSWYLQKSSKQCRSWYYFLGSFMLTPIKNIYIHKYIYLFNIFSSRLSSFGAVSKLPPSKESSWALEYRYCKGISGRSGFPSCWL